MHIFHAPWFLWMLILVPLLAFFLWKWAVLPHAWMRVIPRPLLDRMGMRQNRRGLLGLVVLCSLWILLAILALAKPVTPTTIVSADGKVAARAIIVDMSRSMGVRDIKPSRMDRARVMIDSLSRSNPMPTSLVGYGAFAYLLMPVSDDQETLRHIASSLTPFQLFRQGNKLSEAWQLLKTMEMDPYRLAHVVIFSDGDIDDQAVSIMQEWLQQNIKIDFVALGTKDGGPVPLNADQNMPEGQSRLDLTKLEKLRSFLDFRLITSQDGLSPYYDGPYIFFDGLGRGKDSADMPYVQGAWFLMWFMFILYFILAYRFRR